mgnify:CR=1 FL=1
MATLSLPCCVRTCHASPYVVPYALAPLSLLSIRCTPLVDPHHECCVEGALDVVDQVVDGSLACGCVLGGKA